MHPSQPTSGTLISHWHKQLPLLGQHLCSSGTDREAPYQAKGTAAPVASECAHFQLCRQHWSCRRYTHAGTGAESTRGLICLLIKGTLWGEQAARQACHPKTTFLLRQLSTSSTARTEFLPAVLQKKDTKRMWWDFKKLRSPYTAL